MPSPGIEPGLPDHESKGPRAQERCTVDIGAPRGEVEDEKRKTKEVEEAKPSRETFASILGNR